MKRLEILFWVLVIFLAIRFYHYDKKIDKLENDYKQIIEQQQTKGTENEIRI